MAERVVDELEVVEVDEEHADEPIGAPLAGQRVLDAVVEQRAVGELGQRVVEGAVAELLLERLRASMSREVRTVPATRRRRPASVATVSTWRQLPSGDACATRPPLHPFPELDGLAGRVDLALLPVWTWGPHLGPGHLGPRSAADLLARLGARPRSRSTGARSIRVACHASGTGRSASRGQRFAGHAADVAPGADVRVLQPGDVATITDPEPCATGPNAERRYPRTMTEDIEPRNRFGRSIAAEVAALEADIRHRVVDLEEAFAVRDWAAVARIYREVAAIADRLEELDPNARSVALARADEAMEVARSIRPAALDDEVWTEDDWP